MAENLFENAYEILSRQDLWAMAKDGPNFAGRLKKMENGKYRMNMIATARVDSPWCHNKHNIDRKCDLWHTVFFGQFGFIPRGCRACWKISMALTSVYDLFLLRDFQEVNDQWEGKCGVDRRRYTPARYSGFWYVPMGHSLEEARVYFQTILDALKKEFAPNALYPWKIILKRGCTEMEQRSQKDHGFASTEWDTLGEESDPLEDRLEQLLEDNEELYEQEQNKDTMTHIMKYWIEYAYAINDPTAALLDSDGSLLKENPPMHAYESYSDGFVERMKECRTRLAEKT